jgi:hypothetical protein
MDKIREMMGVCPQFDVLWADLTGREHLMLFAGMKGIPWKRLSQEADDRLGVRPRLTLPPTTRLMCFIGRSLPSPRLYGACVCRR